MGELQKSPQDAVLVKPDFLAAEKPTGLEGITQYVILPRAKVIQALTEKPLREKFGQGAVVAVPLEVQLASLEHSPSFNFTPLFFWPEVLLINPLKLRGSENMIVDRTTDPTNEMFAKAKNPNHRFTPHPNHPNDQSYNRRYMEVLNFVILIQGRSELARQPILLSFQKAEFVTGQKFASLIKMRGAPIFSGVYTATVGLRSGQLGEWYGIDISNPVDVEPWITKDQFEQNKKMYKELLDKHQQSKLRGAEEDSAVAEDLDDSSKF